MIKVDRDTIYESHGYKFKNFVCLSDEEKIMILNWRNHEKVRSMMVNKDVIPLESHLAFIDGLKQRDDCYYWLVIGPEGSNLGVLDVIHIDEEKQLGEIGYYLNQEETGKGFEFMIEANYFVYNQLKLMYNLVTIDETNKDILLFSMYLGTSFEGIKEIDGVRYLYNNHATGDYILTHYDEFNLVDYARFVKRHKNDQILYNIKN